jgi:outer membrane protein TolC
MMHTPLVNKLGAALVLLAVFALEATAQEKSLPLDIATAEGLASSRADEVAARNAAAQAALRAADAAKAKLLPQISGSATGAYLANPPAGLTLGAGKLGKIPTSATTAILLPETDTVVLPATSNTYFKGNLTFSQPIFVWGKIRASIDLALLEAKVAEVDARGAERDSAREANRVYYSALLSERGASILAELCGLAQQIIADRQSALDEGLSTKEQLLSSKADLADLNSRLVEAQESAKSSLEALAFYTGLDADRIELRSDFRDALPPIAEDSLKEAAALSSTAFAEAGARLKEAERKLDLEKGSSLFLPDLSFFASFDTLSPDSGGSMSDSWSWDLSLGLLAKVDFFDGGAARARKKEAAAQVDSAKAALQAAGKGARLEARRAVDAARKAEASLAAARARGDWAAESLRAARASAADQMISRPELNGAQIREASARLTVLEARYALEEAIADLDRLNMEASR